MEIRCRPWAEAGPAAQPEWAALRASNPALRSPYFAWDFTDIVARRVAGVELAILEEGGRPVGYFPFQRMAAGRAVPVGAPLSDAHGAIAAPGLRFDPLALLEACGLRRFEFDHLVADQPGWDPHVREWASSPCLDLAAGFEGWLEQRRRDGRSRFGRLRELRRALARERGGLRFEFDVRDERVLEALLELKSAQYRRTLGADLDLFARPAMAGVVRDVFAARGTALCGVLSALWAGDTLVAAHFGMRSSGRLHWWFPAHAPSLGHYSPGALLLLDIAQAAAADGIGLLDFGKGDEAYKLRMANASVRLAEGAVDLDEADLLLRSYLDQELADSRLRRANLALERDLRRLAAWEAWRAARHELRALRDSLSWRLTQPLRALGDALRGANALAPSIADVTPAPRTADLEAAGAAAQAASAAIRASLCWRLTAPGRSAVRVVGYR